MRVKRALDLTEYWDKLRRLSRHNQREVCHFIEFLAYYEDKGIEDEVVLKEGEERELSEV